MTLPRLVATDLDGTLLRSHREISDRTVTALAAAERAGVEVLMVTARPWRWVTWLADAAHGHGKVVCGNGAFVYDLHAGAVVQRSTFALGEAEGIAADLRREFPGIGFAVEHEDGYEYDDTYVVRDDVEAPTAGRTMAVEEQLARPVGKLLGRVQGMDGAELNARAAAIVGPRGEVAFSGTDTLIEITAPGVTKGAAVERWALDRGIASRDVWAFGDMPNDLPMLLWAGRGYAMANAHATVLAATSWRAPANTDDGVARVLEEALAGTVSGRGDL